jgi:hypothetical protein
MLVDELLSYLFDGQSSHPIAASLATWLTSSRQFTAFVNTYHTKIRKKLRIAQDPENLWDLQLELETAYLLLQERSLRVEYEPQLKNIRSPDFAVRFTTSFVFMVEVTRIRTTQSGTLLLGERFTDMLCNKLGQLLAQHSNLLLVGSKAPHLVTHDDLHTTLLRLQQRAENNDPTIVHRHGFRDRAEFFHHYQRLSAILLRGIPIQEPIVLWDNPQAKYPLPAKVHTALSRSHTL